jgi:tetratricopeptide (TPR) repeat protein
MRSLGINHLSFQGNACLNKGTTPEHLTHGHADLPHPALGQDFTLSRATPSAVSDFFGRALTIDARNIGALVGMAGIDMIMGVALLTDDRTAHFSAAETNAIKALSLAPDDAPAHFFLGCVYMFTNRTAQGIAECDQALALNPNLADLIAAVMIADEYLVLNRRLTVKAASENPVAHRAPRSDQLNHYLQRRYSIPGSANEQFT